MKTLSLSILYFCLFTGCSKNYLRSYQGTPYTDEQYLTGVQSIPGKVQCEYYDKGGASIAYYDTDNSNSGSGGLNPKDETYLNEFRINEAVDISYTKTDGIDDNPHNLVTPKMEQLYVGWTEAGEWTNYTIEVQKKGLYQIGLMYTANQNAEISLAINGVNKSGVLRIPSTYAEADTIDWRQWHHWNYLKSIAIIELKKGTQILTLRTVSAGQMNFDYLNFVRLN
ncbi:carbohydrate-binding protein [uncultured Arcticibacterium sp.]|uniref:carbohydrate-binding protein n=1 Tax=uncultured Arcticibacterium sp. TaxID=2173042 RepID=UPI0030FBF6AA